MQIIAIFKSIYQIAVALVLLVLMACTNYEYHSAQKVTPYKVAKQEQVTLSEQSFIDVVIAVFGDGLDETDTQESVYTSVRKSEGVWYANKLRKTLDYSRAWGVVRVTPKLNVVSDLMIQGEILSSNGETLKLHIVAVDAQGQKWLDKHYSYTASRYTYDSDFASEEGPFHSLFSEIANDLYLVNQEKKTKERDKIKQIASLRFASSLLPQHYQDYLKKDQQNRYYLKRVPADNDTMMQRINRVKVRNDLYLDVVQDYYRVFTRDMAESYTEWRKLSYHEVRYERQLKAQAKNEKVAGVAAILAGVASQTSGSAVTRSVGGVSIFSGAALLRSGYTKADAAILHTETLRELGESLELSLEPSIVELQDRSITLSGTVEEQFHQWRKILKAMLIAERGVENASDEQDDTQGILRN